MLDPATATCLGVACKKLYAAYQSARIGLGPVRLYVPAPCCSDGAWDSVWSSSGYCLGHLLCSWASGERALFYSPDDNVRETLEWWDEWTRHFNKQEESRAPKGWKWLKKAFGGAIRPT